MSKNLRRAWDSHIQNILSSLQEDEVDRIFAPLGKVDKILSTTNNSTSDRKIDSTRMLIEVTTIGIDEVSGVVRQDSPYWIRKINQALKHLKKNNVAQFSGYYKGGVIYLDSVILLTDLVSKLKDGNFIKNFTSTLNGLDYVVFVPRPIAPDYSDSREKYSTVVWFKPPLLKLTLEKLDIENKTLLKI